MGIGKLEKQTVWQLHAVHQVLLHDITALCAMGMCKITGPVLNKQYMPAITSS
jgi:hypothetical protein